MSKTVTVFGATGQQGGGVVSELLKDRSWKIRGVTRNPDSDKAKALAAKGVEIVAANLEQPETLAAALEGTQAVFGVTNFWEYLGKHDVKETAEIEYMQGIQLAKAVASVSTLEHYVWSTLPSAEKHSGGKTPVPHLDAKAKVDIYIKNELPELAAKTTFIMIGYYASNMVNFPLLVPGKWSSTNGYLNILPVPASTLLPNAGDAGTNTGRLVKTILSHPEKTLPGRYVAGCKGEITLGDALKAWSNATGKEATYVQCTNADFIKLFGLYGEELGAHFAWADQYSANEGWINSEVLTADDLQVELVGFEEALKQLFASGVSVPE